MLNLMGDVLGGQNDIATTRRRREHPEAPALYGRPAAPCTGGAKTPACAATSGQLRCRHDCGSGAFMLLRAVFLGLIFQLALLPGPSTAIFLQQQSISTNTVTSFCGFRSIERYKTWCENSLSAFVASNSSCQQYGVCIPLDGDDAMSCSGSSTCSGWRRGGTRVAACLVLDATALTVPTGNGSALLCDLEIQGSSVFDRPPPSPAAAPPPVGAKEPRDWAMWKSMAIICSILGFAALLVVTVLLVRWCLRRRAGAASLSPVTILSEAEKKRIEEEVEARAQAEFARGAADATVTLRPTAPDGKPILAYGSSYPPPPPLLIPSITANGANRLPPTAGDALLQAVADSRAAHNGPPMRTPPVDLPPLGGVTLPPPGSAPDAAAAAAAAAAPTTAAAVASVGGVITNDGASEPDPPVPVVTPAALVPPAAATLQNPTGSG